MKMACLVLVSLQFWTMLFISSNGVLGEPLFSSMFVFGDSLIENGNNNYLWSCAKANYEPYGIDFPEGPTGRFCNGKTIIDILGEMTGLPYLPAFKDTLEQGKNVTMGVNYASASAGIIDETGRNLGDRFSFNKQVENFERTLSQLKTHMEDKKLSHHLAKALTIVNHGNNDYINNYLLPEFYATSFIYDPKTYANLLIEGYKRHILNLHDLGLRKFLLGGIGPLGCIPNQLSKGVDPPGQCVIYVNYMVQVFNGLLRSLVDQLNAEYHDSTFVYGNIYKMFGEIINNPKTYGFTVTDSGCCGVGRNKGQMTCLPMSIPCTNRGQHVFWDAFHPTQAVHEILAHRALTGPPSDCYPINLKQMAQM